MSDSPHASPNDAAIDSATPLASTTTPTSGSPWRWDATWILVIVAVVAGRIVENMHAATARRLLARAEAIAAPEAEVEAA